MCNFCGLLGPPSYQSDFQSARRSRPNPAKKIKDAHDEQNTEKLFKISVF
jgi:hypothetical protein